MMKSGVKRCPKCFKKQPITTIMTKCCGEYSRWESTLKKINGGFKNETRKTK